ncbi:hypothetical protein ABVN80_10505 [Acinetobacter baumannii]
MGATVPNVGLMAQKLKNTVLTTRLLKFLKQVLQILMILTLVVLLTQNVEEGDISGVCVR